MVGHDAMAGIDTIFEQYTMIGHDIPVGHETPWPNTTVVLLQLRLGTKIWLETIYYQVDCWTPRYGWNRYDGWLMSWLDTIQRTRYHGLLDGWTRRHGRS